MNINQSSTHFIGSTNKAYVLIGDTVTYTFSVTNTGNTDITNSLFTDILPPSLSFIDGSVKINNISQTLYNPSDGIFLDTIVPNQTETVSFEVIIVSNLGTQIITNTATLNYNDDDTLLTTVITSNIIPLTFVNLDTSISLSADKPYAVVGEDLIYTIVVSNLGSIDINIPVVTDFLPSGVLFVPNSVVINGSPQSNTVSPITGITLPNISGGNQVIIEFMANVLSSPTIPISTQASVVYQYTPILGTTPQVVTQESNTLTLPRNIGYLTVSKSINKNIAMLGEVLTYTINLINNGSLDVFDVLVSDMLDSNLEYYSNLTINGEPSNQDITIGVNVGSISINNECIVTFDAKVSSIPKGIFISNHSVAEYSYDQPLQMLILDNTNTMSLESSSSSSNVVNISIIPESIHTSKSCNKDIIKIGESAIFTIDIVNTTSLDIFDLVVVDTIPNQLQVTDITINSVSTSGNLNMGVNVGSLPSGMAKIIEVTVMGISTLENFVNTADIIAQFIPQISGPYSYVNTPVIATNSLSVVNPNLNLFKSFSVTDTTIGQIVECTILVENAGNINLDNIRIYDLFVNDLEYIYSSLYIDGIKNNTQDIITGIDLGSMIPGQTHIITFKIKVIGNSENPITNLSKSLYNYKTSSCISKQYGSSLSNYALLYISTINLTLNKTAYPTEAHIGDNINYTITLTNNSSVDLYGVILKDKLPRLLTLIPQTFTVNGLIYNITQNELLSGFYIGDIPLGQTVTVIFSANLIGTYSTSGKPMILDNIASAQFAYVLPNGYSNFSTTPSVSCSINKLN